VLAALAGILALARLLSALTGILGLLARLLSAALLLARLLLPTLLLLAVIILLARILWVLAHARSPVAQPLTGKPAGRRLSTHETPKFLAKLLATT
jgi:hypothetical protein